MYRLVFGDHILQAATLRKERLNRQIQRMRDRVDQMHQDYHAQVRKRELLVRYQEKVNEPNVSVISTTSSTLPRQQPNLSRQMKGMTESQLEYLL